VARCLALLGMVATHVLADRGPDGELALGHELAGGRAAALFAVLAGVSLALVSGRESPPAGRTRLALSAGVVVRALLIAVTGLLLGELDSGLAVILTYYGLLFVLGLPFLGLRAPALFGLAVVWGVVAPVVSHLVRPELPPRGFANPTLGQLFDQPGRLLSELTFTGYYPAVPWLAYLLAGMAVGRMDLHRRRNQAVLAGAGAAVAVTSVLGSRWFTDQRWLLDAVGAESTSGLLDQVSEGMHGNTPTGEAWAWLLVVAPHSTTPFDLAQTTGSALLVIGLALLVAGMVQPVGRRFLAVLFGAGTMTLTLYSLHVVTRTAEVWPEETPDSFPSHLALLLGIGAVYVALRRRGPLERLVGAASGRTARALSPRAPDRAAA
jgi:hypothetical protein